MDKSDDFVCVLFFWAWRTRVRLHITSIFIYFLSLFLSRAPGCMVRDGIKRVLVFCTLRARARLHVGSAQHYLNHFLWCILLLRGMKHVQMNVARACSIRFRAKICSVSGLRERKKGGREKKNDV